MSLAETVRLIAALGLTGVLAWAAVSDVRTRLIPNRAVLAVLALFAPWAAATLGADLGSAVAAGAIAFAVGFVFYLTGVMGAGDSKLFAAVALFTGLAYLPLFALATTVSGGALALAMMVARPQRALVMLKMQGKGDWGRGVPYGVAIAIGGALAVWARLTQLPAVQGFVPG